MLRSESERSRGRAHRIRKVFRLMSSRLPLSRLTLTIFAIIAMMAFAVVTPAKHGRASSGSSRKASKASARSARYGGRSSRGGRISARAERGRRGREVARGRGRYRAPRWANHNVSAMSVGGHGAGVHNFLTQEWSKEQSVPLSTSPNLSANGTPSMTATGPALAASL